MSGVRVADEEFVDVQGVEDELEDERIRPRSGLFVHFVAEEFRLAPEPFGVRVM